MRTYPRNGQADNRHASVLKIKVSADEKSGRIDLGLAILSAVRPGEQLTCAEIAAYCDCCPQRINQIEAGALERLRGLLRLMEQPPERLTGDQAAWIIKCRPQEVPLLVEAGLLKPLDSSRPNGVTFFDAPELLELVKDQAWRTSVTNTLNRHRHKRTGMGESVWQMVWLVFMAPQLFA